MPGEFNGTHCERNVEALSFNSTVILKSGLSLNKLDLSGDFYSGPKIRPWQTAGDDWFANSGGAEERREQTGSQAAIVPIVLHSLTDTFLKKFFNAAPLLTLMDFWFLQTSRKTFVPVPVVIVSPLRSYNLSSRRIWLMLPTPTHSPRYTVSHHQNAITPTPPSPPPPPQHTHNTINNYRQATCLLHPSSFLYEAFNRSQGEQKTSTHPRSDLNGSQCVCVCECESRDKAQTHPPHSGSSPRPADR